VDFSRKLVSIGATGGIERDGRSLRVKAQNSR
jgi:hypothetical protein